MPPSAVQDSQRRGTAQWTQLFIRTAAATTSENDDANDKSHGVEFGFQNLVRVVVINLHQSFIFHRPSHSTVKNQHCQALALLRSRKAKHLHCLA